MKKNDHTETVGILYPGQSYSLPAPSLFYFHFIFETYKIHYLGIDTRYGANQQFFQARSELKTTWIDTDAQLIGEYLHHKTRKYRRRVFIAKSLGTAQLYYQLNNNFIHNDDILIFQTPIMPFDELQDALLKNKNDSLIIYGTQDPALIKKGFSRIESKENVQVVELEKAGHSFEEEKNIEESINNLRIVMVESERFLARVLG